MAGQYVQSSTIPRHEVFGSFFSTSLSCLDEFAELDGLAKGYDIDALEPYKWVSDSTSQTRKSKSKSKKSSRSKGYSAV